MTLIELITTSVGPPVAFFLPPDRLGRRRMAFADDLGVNAVVIRHPAPAAYVSGVVEGLFTARLRGRLGPDD